MNSQAADDAESVDDFLARIASLKERRDREDEERTRKLEEEIAQGRRERAARRAERARSISPIKSSPAPSVSTMPDNKTPSKLTSELPIDLSPYPQTPNATLTRSSDALPSPVGLLKSEDTNLNRPLPTPPHSSSTMSTRQPTAASLARSGTLSWQQRPSSRDSESTNQPPIQSATVTPQKGLEANDNDDISRDQIAKSLGAKDPSWFRQTADRGIGSAAHRKQQEIEDTDSYLIGRSMQLPGMSRESTIETEKESRPRERTESAAITPSNNARATPEPSPRIGLYSGRARSPPKQNDTFTLSASQILEPTLDKSPDTSDISDMNRPASMPPPDSASVDRPRSPTKGLGGFVESAMMKRSESVSKRWSVQAAAGLKRGDSVSTSRNTLGTLGGGQLASAGLPRSPTRQPRPLQVNSSPLSSSRPSSSHGLVATIPSSTDFDHPGMNAAGLDNTTSESNLSSMTAAQATSTEHTRDDTSRRDDDVNQRTSTNETLPVASSKTMESRRWSPTKSSWLESALSKPESPRLVPAKLEQPIWRSDLQKSRNAKSDQESTIDSPATKFEVKTTTGLLRSPPLGAHTKPQSMSGLADVFSTGTAKTSSTMNTREKPVRPSKPTDVKKADSDVRSKLPTDPKQEINAAENLPSTAEWEDSDQQQPVVPSVNLSSATKQGSTSIRMKPQTPPKTDFRANLKPRRTESQDNGAAEPEFKAVFGKLKRAETKSYVAPDLLKDNITRGKAGLVVTGGPQKSKTVDEFKESILQKKEAMKQKPLAEVLSKPSIPEKPSTVLPEALAKRQMLSRSKDLSGGSKSFSDEPSLPTKPYEKEKSTESAVNPEEPPLMASLSKSTSVNHAMPTTNGSETRMTTSTISKDNSEVENVPVSTLASLPKQELETSKLAARLNPALAGFLSRSTSPRVPVQDSTLVRSSHHEVSNRTTRQDVDDTGAASGLTHITKARAKGPKRRLPKTEARMETMTINDDAERPTDAVVKVDPKSFTTLQRGPVSDGNEAKIDRPVGDKSSLPGAVAKMVVSRANGNFGRATESPSNAEADELEKKLKAETPRSKPVVATKSPDLRKVSSPKPEVANVLAQTPAGPEPPRKFNIASDKPLIEATLPPTDMPKATTGTAKIDGPGTLPLKPSTSKLNSGKATKPSIDEKKKPAITKPENSTIGLGLDLKRPTPSVQSTATAELTPPPDPVTASDESRERIILREFFDEYPSVRRRAEFDTQAIMTSSAKTTDKLKTLSMQIWEINSDGRRQPMPPQQEHILFEDSMYLCLHSFQRTNGSKSTEVYLWTGDFVSEAAIEDAQLFCRKAARDNNARLDILKQGTESANFFQALGGIVITRRNKSSALYMLCCRRHLGHIAFDEVDLDPESLCSGFAYIVSAKFGRLYLWKGKGSNADELGCARLIGMDLGLTGEIEEIDEGKEPNTFWESFIGRPLRRDFEAQDIWSLKASQDGYKCHLYRVEHERPKVGSAWFSGRRGSSPPKTVNRAAVEEISPFVQSDIKDDTIYILDLFFRLFVYVGDKASSKDAEFVTAVMLAQEMKILAPSLQDRPMMPICHVVFGPPPADFKAGFRKWQTRSSRISTILPLEETTEALEWRPQ